MNPSKSEDEKAHDCERQIPENSTIASVDEARNLDRKLPRVTLRTGSPQYAKRIFLRSVPRTKVKSTTVPSMKQGIGPISSTRSLWASTTIINTARRELEKGSTKPKSKTAASRPPSRINARRYSISTLLALRPSDPAMIERTSLNGLTERPRTRKDLSNRLRAIQQTPFYPPTKTIFYNNTENRLPKLPLQETRDQLQNCADIDLRPSYTDSCREKRVPESLPKTSGFSREPTPETKVVANREWNEAITSAIPRCHLPLQTPVKNHLPAQDRLRSQIARADELESRIKPALSRRKAQRSSESPRKLHNVKWDPVVIEYGPVIISAQLVNSRNAGVSTGVPKHESSKSKLSPSLLSPEPEYPPKIDMDVTSEFMKSLTTLKKGDRHKVFQLLEALRNVDSDDSSDTDTVIVNERPKSRPTRKPFRTILNPEAPEFKRPSKLSVGTSQNQSTSLHGQESLRISRKRPHVPVQDGNLKEPIWVKKDTLLPRAKKPGSYKEQSSDSHFPQDLHFYPMPEPHHLSSLIPEMLLGLPTSYSTSTLPMHGFQPLAFNYRACGNPEIPIIDIATGRVPSESESGREAFAHALPAEMQKLVNQFMEHYPHTGKIKAAPPVPVRSRHAATIQQRLEYLLMEQKEKKWREQQSGRCATRVASLSLSNKMSRAIDHHGREPLAEIRNYSNSED